MSSFNESLIEAINKFIPKKKDQLDFLMNSLVLGKETAYRRLRGDVPFTFSESCIIARKLEISLDRLAYVHGSGKPVFELEIFPDNPLNYIHYRLTQHEQSFNFFINAELSTMMTACSMLPVSFFFNYELLLKVHAFRLIYQVQTEAPIYKFGEFVFPEEFNTKRKFLVEQGHLLPESIIIFDHRIFTAFIKSTLYFHSLDIITDKEREDIKNELGELITDLEEETTRGKNKGETRTQWYLSNIDFYYNYTYIEGGNFRRAYMDGIYMMDTISSSDPQICVMHKKWIESLKRYSTLISVSGEKERKAFFEKQREFLKEL